MSYVFPAAQCDLELTLANKGLLNAVIYAGKLFRSKCRYQKRISRYDIQCFRVGFPVRHLGAQKTTSDRIIFGWCVRGFERLLAKCHRSADIQIFRWFYVSEPHFSVVMGVFASVR